MGNKLNYIDACFDICAASILLNEGIVDVDEHIKVATHIIKLEDTDIYGEPTKNIGISVRVFKDNLLADYFKFNYAGYPPYLLNMLLDDSQDLQLRIKAVPQMHMNPLGVLIKSKMFNKNLNYMPCGKGEFTEHDRDKVINEARRLSAKVMIMSENNGDDELGELSGAGLVSKSGAR